MRPCLCMGIGSPATYFDADWKLRIKGMRMRERRNAIHNTVLSETGSFSSYLQTALCLVLPLHFPSYQNADNP